MTDSEKDKANQTIPQMMGHTAQRLLGPKIKQRREELGMTQIYLAKAMYGCRISPSQKCGTRQDINRLESMKAGFLMSLPRLYSIASALKIEISDLLPTVAEVMKEAGIVLQVDRQTIITKRLEKEPE